MWSSDESRYDNRLSLKFKLFSSLLASHCHISLRNHRTCIQGYLGSLESKYSTMRQSLINTAKKSSLLRSFFPSLQISFSFSHCIRGTDRELCKLAVVFHSSILFWKSSRKHLTKILAKYLSYIFWVHNTNLLCWWTPWCQVNLCWCQYLCTPWRSSLFRFCSHHQIRSSSPPWLHLKILADGRSVCLLDTL